MTDDPSADPFGGLLGDLAHQLRALPAKFMAVVHTRIELTGAEIKAEVEQRIKRLILVVVPACFILTALGLVNLGLVAWLSESMGPVVASFTLAAIYAVIGVVWLLIWQASGGLNPKKEAGEKDAVHDPFAGPRP